MESLTMSNSSREPRRKALPVRTWQQDRNISDEYDLNRLHENSSRSALPIDTYEEQIVNQIESNPVMVIKGDTGSGKTTRVPMMILNHWRETKGRLPNILVTQPRKIAAVSVCRRVCDEHGWTEGKICGYQVSLDRCASEDTCILYCTTGILLQKLIQDKNLNEYSHIVLDEVHDREADMDFCILVIKQLMRELSSQVRIVLMSATLDTRLFCDYFSFPVGRFPPRLEPAPMFRVDGKPYDVKVFYTNDFAKHLGCHMPQTLKDDAQLTVEAINLCVKLIHCFDQREGKEKDKGSEREIVDGRNLGSRRQDKGSVLCFLPGLPEIESLNDELSSSQTEDCQFQLIQLHSKITLNRQEVIFKRPKKGMRKVILATNIAESSITIPDIKYVIDFCMTKRLHCNVDSNLQHLKLEWTSKASAEQRRGRAGRVDNGVCYRMVASEFFTECLDEQEVPEMQRASLSQLVLKSKRLNLYPPKKLLSLAMDHPGLERIQRAILELKELEALTAEVSEPGGRGYDAVELTADDLDEEFDGDLTFVGLVMADIPLDVHLTKLILMGHVFGLLEEAIIMACALSQQESVFLREFDHRKQLRTLFTQISFSYKSESDPLSALNAYRCWQDKELKNGFYNEKEERKWEKNNGLNTRRLRKDVDERIKEVKRRLERFGLHSTNAQSSLAAEEPSDGSVDPVLSRDFFLKILIAGAFYPNFFVRHSTAADDRAETLRHKQKDMNNHDPLTTVYLRGFDEAVGPLYENEIRKFFYDQLGNDLILKSYNMDVNFEGSKAFVEFSEKMPSGTDSVLPPVLVSLKLAQIINNWRGGTKSNSNPINKYRLMTSADAEKYLAQVQADIQAGNYEEKKIDSHYPKFRVEPPPPTRTLMPILITYVESPSHFWAIHNDDATKDSIREIDDKCNDSSANKKRLDSSTFRVHEANNLCLARWFDVNQEGDGRFYRAVICLKDTQEEDESSMGVFFVDYGNKVALRWEELFEIPVDIARIKHQAMEFCLQGIKPNPEQYFEGWPARVELRHRGATTSKIVEKAVSLLEGERDIFVQVFSILRGVVRGKLFLPPPPQRQQAQQQRMTSGRNLNWNETLVQLGHAIEAPESVESVRNHEARERLRIEEESRRSYAQQSAKMQAEYDFYGAALPQSTLGDLDCSLSDGAQRKLLQAQRAVNAMEKVEGNRQANWQSIGEGGSYPCKNRQGLFQGPFSAYTYDFTSLTVSGGGCGIVKISEDSVNTVAIDGAAEELHQRLMVAANVSLNSTGNTIRASGTTIMPSVLGLPSMLTLLFAPQVEFQTERNGTAMLGARCGLGWYHNIHQDPIALYPDHDIELTFDVEINVDDIRDVNTLRLLIYNALDGDVKSETLKKSFSEIKKSQAKIRQAARALLLKSRVPCAPNKNIEWRPWGFIEDLPLTVPLSESIFPGQRVQLLSAICPDAPATAAGTRGRGRGGILNEINYASPEEVPGSGPGGSFLSGIPNTSQGRTPYGEGSEAYQHNLNPSRPHHQQERLYENVQSFVQNPSAPNTYGWNT